MDFVPPFPAFDPEPTDAPDQDETDARAALLRLRNGLGPCWTLASLKSLPLLEWRRMWILLENVGLLYGLRTEI
jgi:hypothetical protein